MSNEKLAEALRELFVKWLESRSPFRTTVEVEAAWEGWKANTAIAAMLAAEAAQAQAQSMESIRGAVARGWCSPANSRKVMGPDLADAIAREVPAMLAAAPQQAAEPVRQFRVVPRGSVWTDVKDPEIWASVTAHPESYETRTLYNDPQPAQDASKYQELLMAVEKKFPGENRHDTALRYIRQAELRSCEPKCDSSMAKEAGR